MKILKAKVDWMKQYANHPSLYVLVDKIPAYEDCIYSEKDGIYYAENEGYARYLYYKSPGDGFGGSVFSLKMKDGTTKECKGPWSSRAGVVNRTGFGPIVDVAITDKLEAWERGYTFTASAITLELATIAAKKARCKLVNITEDDGGDITWLPSLRYDIVVKPFAKHQSHDTCGYRRFFRNHTTKDFETLREAAAAQEPK